MQAPPPVLKVRPFNIPVALTAQTTWILWAHRLVSSRWAKVPLRPSGALASVSEPSSWCAFDEALAAYQGGRFSGIGIVLDGRSRWDGAVLTAIDLDHVRGDPVREERASRIVDDVGSYTEVSPSGSGLRIFCYSQPLSPFRRDGVEVYFNRRYMTVTGHAWEGRW